MNYKKIASLSLSVIYLLSALPALADEDALHKSKSLNVETVLSDNFRSANPTEDAENGISVLNVSAPLVKDGADASGIIGDSPAENIFSVDGRRFILLDKNENGDYFVMADEEYGQSSERNFDTDIKLEKLTSEDWGFNPQNSGSLAYKINNSASGLLSGNANNALSFTDTYTGDKTPKVIPESMLDDLLEHDWEIEAFYPDSAIHPNNTVAQSWIDSQAAMPQNAEKTVKAKLSYLSYTEFMQYKNKIGFKNYDSDDITAGMYLRTPFGYVRGTKSSTTYRLGNMQIRFKDDKSGLCFTAVNAKDASKTMVRPVMWLKANFFKNNKIDLKNAGANILTEMHSLYTANDLSDIYDEDDVFWFSGKEKAWDWGHYPQHPKERSVLSDGYEEYSLPKHGPSPSENLFTIGGRRFIMLDRNAKGEYFVMADEEYGQLRPITPTDTTPETLGKMMGYEWRFNPENPNSAAAVLCDENSGILSGKPDNALSWVNGTYTGSKDKKVIPTEMTDDVLLKTWEIEPVYVFTHMSTTADQYAAYKEYEAKQYAEPKNGYTTINARIVYPSFTEIMTYKDKIGFNDYLSSHIYAGTQTRTAASEVFADAANGDKNGLRYRPGFLSIKIISASGTTTRMQIANFIEPELYMVRPVMWLKEGFFANNKIDLNTAGETVLLEMRTAYEPIDYLDKYSVDEINTIYGASSNAPTVDNLATGGNPQVGGSLIADYKFSSPVGASESCTMVYWLACDTKDGNYKYTGESGNTFEISENYKGKYIKYVIMPKDSNDITGRLYMSEPTSAVSDKKSEVVVHNVDLSGEMLNISLKNLSNADLNAEIICNSYSDGGKVYDFADSKAETISIGGGATKNYSVDFSGYKNITVLNEIGQPIYTKSSFEPALNGIEYKPYRTDVNPTTGEVILTGINTAAVYNGIAKLTVKNENKVFYEGSVLTNTNGEYIFRFKMPNGTTSGVYNTELNFFGTDKTESTFYWISPAESGQLLSDINNADSQSKIFDILQANSGVFLGSDKWWSMMDKTAKENVTKAVYEKIPYTALDKIKDVVFEVTALNIFNCCKTGDEINDVLEHFSSIYAIRTDNSVCYGIYDKMTADEKAFARNAMSLEKPTASNDEIIKTFDRGVLLAAISRAKEANDIKNLLDNTKYRNLITGFTNYNDYDAQTLALHLYSYGDINTIDEFKNAVSKCPKNSSDNTSKSPSGGSGKGSGSSISTDYTKPTVTEPVNNEYTEYFNDLSDYDWAKTAINYLAENGYINGVGENMFAPSELVTREEFVKMIASVFGLKYTGSENVFADVPNDHWAYPFIMAAYNDGTVNGAEDGLFGLGAQITRQDMAAMVYRAITKHGEISDADAKFSDLSDVSEYAVRGVCALNGAGYINGYPDGSFKPFNTATRAEAAQIIYNVVTGMSK